MFVVGLLTLALMACFGLFVVSLLLLPIKRWRPKTKPMAQYSGLVLVPLIVALVISVFESPNAANSAGKSEPVPTRQTQPSTNSGQTVENLPPQQAQTVQATTPSPAFAPPAVQPTGVSGRAKICLTDDTIKFNGYSEVTIPATTIFREDCIGASGSFACASDKSSSVVRPIITVAPVALTKANHCAEAEVKLYIEGANGPTTTQASDNHIYQIDDIVDYQMPTQKPAVEFGKLVDDIGVKAILLSDVSATVQKASANEDAKTKDAKCRQDAANLASYMGAVIGSQTHAMVQFENTGIDGEMSISCGSDVSTKPDLSVFWNKHGKPPTQIVAYAAKAGEFYTGVKVDEIKLEALACVDEALKHQIAERDFFGAKIECTAGNDGPGSVTIYRRFGAYPTHDPVPVPPAPDPEACKDDWSRCQDNGEIAKLYSKIFEARVSCKMAANKGARFGTPEWPWLVFQSIKTGNDGPRTGIVTLVEQDAKFQNGFGAMAHVVVQCVYDMRAKVVLDVAVEER